MSTRIVIVDDHELFREAIRLLIENEGLGEVIAEAENGQVFLDLLQDHTPDLVLMDIEMPVMGGFEATIKALERNPSLKILMLTMPGNRHDYSDIINAGVKGFVLKTGGNQVLKKAIKKVIAGEYFFLNEPLPKIIVNKIE
jgi:DNA-binding NarL/FixJ family response regulator